MIFKMRKTLLIICAAFSVTATAAYADRKPTLKERNRIENQLKSLGFTSWDDIEYDTDRDVWEVDDAQASDGRYYDLKLHRHSLNIIRRQLDD